MKCQEFKKCKKLQHNVLIRTHIFSQREGHDTAEKAVEEAGREPSAIFPNQGVCVQYVRGGEMP